MGLFVSYCENSFEFQRTHQSQLRSANEMASHDQPPPNLPDGPYQKLSGKIFILLCIQ